MTHRFPIKEIARQSGLGPATVDRVLNNRAHVSAQTRARVSAAVAELVAQEQQLAARGRRMFVDVVMEAPSRFTSMIRTACTAVVPEVVGAVYRPRFEMRDVMSDAEIIAVLTRIRKRGSQGVILKARDVPPIRAEVDALAAAGIPVVTLVTDMPHSARVAYVGIDNAKAGRTAGYLLAHILPPGAGTVLASRSQDAFQGEALRYEQFRAQFQAARPGYRIVEVTGGAGVSQTTLRQVPEALVGVARVDAVYSMGGGNGAILDALRRAGRAPTHFLAHDLDADNFRLLRRGEISFVLYHDSKLDMRHAFRALSAWHGLVPPVGTELYSDVQVVTPFNLPETDLFGGGG